VNHLNCSERLGQLAESDARTPSPRCETRHPEVPSFDNKRVIEREGRVLELYNFAQSTCSLKVRICLAEKEVEWVDHPLISRNHDHLSDWYLKLNPNGVVPTLIHDGRSIFESSVIIQYLDQIFPQSPLMPTDPYTQAQLRSWLAFVDLVTTPAVRYPSFQFGGLLLKFQNMSDEDFYAKSAGRPTKSGFYKKMDKMKGFPDEDIAESLNDIRKTAARMDALFDAYGGPWLFGEQYTLGDIAVAPLMDRMEDLGFEQLWTKEHSEQYPELNLGRGSHSHIVEGNADEAAWKLRYPVAAR
jgi:glutathione S-transferase